MAQKEYSGHDYFIPVGAAVLAAIAVPCLQGVETFDRPAEIERLARQIREEMRAGTDSFSCRVLDSTGIPVATVGVFMDDKNHLQAYRRYSDNMPTDKKYLPVTDFDTKEDRVIGTSGEQYTPASLQEMNAARFLEILKGCINNSTAKVIS